VSIFRILLDGFYSALEGFKKNNKKKEKEFFGLWDHIVPVFTYRKKV
jgi:hypothetical protein